VTDRIEPAAIELRDVVRRWGSVLALDGVSLDVPRGCLQGLIGLNGAGKSTLLHVALGLVAPTSGTARVLGVAVPRIASLSGRVGVVTHRLGLEPALTALENLRLHALRHRRRDVDPEAQLRRLDLASLARKRVGRLSQGERQRLAMARALLLRPDVLVLDEPLSNLDPEAAHRAVEILRGEVRTRGVAVLISSHQLRHVERASDRLALLHEGRLVLEGTLDAFVAATRAVVLVRAAPLDEAVRVLRAHPIVERVAVDSGRGREGGGDAAGDEAAFATAIRVTMRESRPELLGEALHGAGVRVRHLGVEPVTLDDLFRATVIDGRDPRDASKDSPHPRASGAADGPGEGGAESRS